VFEVARPAKAARRARVTGNREVNFPIADYPRVMTSGVIRSGQRGKQSRRSLPEMSRLAGDLPASLRSFSAVGAEADGRLGFILPFHTAPAPNSAIASRIPAMTKRMLMIRQGLIRESFPLAKGQILLVATAACMMQ
jgi:hypothetical protein